MANIITCVRIVCGVALLFCPVFSPAFYTLYIVAGISDMIDRNLVSGVFTVEDASLFGFMRMLKDAEDVFIEPSGCAAFSGPAGLLTFGREYLVAHGLDENSLAASTQICWATGGRLVPDEIRDAYMNAARGNN